MQCLFAYNISLKILCHDDVTFLPTTPPNIIVLVLFFPNIFIYLKKPIVKNQNNTAASVNTPSERIQQHKIYFVKQKTT
jgi:hypothetical protein